MNGERDDAVLFEVPLPHAEAPAAPPRLLTNPPFLWLVAADGLANLGRWAFYLAVVGDAAYGLRASPAQVGLLLGAFSLPLILFSPLYGSIADRSSPKLLLSVTVAATIPVPALALATDSLGWLYVAAAIFGALHGAVLPARGALVPRLVPADRLVQANGMISAATSLQLVIGPALAAALVRLGGTDAPYAVTMAGALLATVCYARVPDRRAVGGGTRSALAEVTAGFREGWAKPPLRRLFAISVSVWFLIGLLISLEPLYVMGTLRLGQDVLGMLWAIFGIGEMVGGLLLTRVRAGSGRESLLVGGGLLVAALGFLIYVSFPVLAAAIAGNIVFGLGFPLFVAPAQALIQRIATHSGRVSAAFSMVGEAGPVLAALALAIAGDFISVRPWLLVSGIAFAFVALSALRLARGERAEVRP